MQNRQIDLIIPNKRGSAVKFVCIKPMTFVSLLDGTVSGGKGRLKHVISCEIIVKNDAHIANYCQLLDELFEEGGFEVKSMAHADDNERRIELLDVNIDQFLHDELDELRLVKLNRPHIVLLGKVPGIDWKNQQLLVVLCELSVAARFSLEQLVLQGLFLLRQLRKNIVLYQKLRIVVKIMRVRLLLQGLALIARKTDILQVLG